MIPAPKTVWAYAWVEPSPNGEGAVRASGRGSREATEARLAMAASGTTRTYLFYQPA